MVIILFRTRCYNFTLPQQDEDGKSRYFITEISDRTQIDEYNGKYRKLNKENRSKQQLEAQLFNERYIRKKKSLTVIFICEGIYDALSIEEVGGKAIALVGVGQNRFLSILKKYKPDSYFILYLDNDKAGQNATESLKSKIDDLGLNYKIITSSNSKDANEALQMGKNAFKRHIEGGNE